MTNIVAGDQSTDTPTNNHCTVNAIDSLADSWTITEGNRFVAQAANNERGKCNFGIDSADTDGWYWECELDAVPDAFTSTIGILPVDNYNTGNSDVVDISGIDYWINPNGTFYTYQSLMLRPNENLL